VKDNNELFKKKTSPQRKYYLKNKEAIRESYLRNKDEILKKKAECCSWRKQTRV
jgi:hypothetical protein